MRHWPENRAARRVLAVAHDSTDAHEQQRREEQPAPEPLSCHVAIMHLTGPTGLPTTCLHSASSWTQATVAWLVRLVFGDDRCHGVWIVGCDHWTDAATGIDLQLDRLVRAIGVEVVPMHQVA